MSRTARMALGPEELQRSIGARRLGTKVHYFETLASTNDEACRLARGGAPEGEIVIAEEQTRGKGRMGRDWASPRGLNLYLSVILRPSFPPARASQITLMSAVAVADTVGSFLPVAPEIKWPNDILVDGKKVAGILTESCCEGDRLLFVVLGVGVNLNFPKELMPEEIREKATSLMVLTREPIDRVRFARRLIRDIERCYGDLEVDGFEIIARRWDRLFRLRGKTVSVEASGRRLLGRAQGIDSDGALIVESEGGRRERVIAGDVIPVDP